MDSDQRKQSLIAELVLAVKEMPDFQVYTNKADGRYIDLTVINASDFLLVGDLLMTMRRISEIRRELIRLPAAPPEPPTFETRFGWDEGAHNWLPLKGDD